MYTLMLLKYLLKDAFMKTDLHLMAKLNAFSKTHFFQARLKSINKNMLDYSDKCFIFYLNLFDCHLLFTNASKFEGDCKYVQLWIFTHLTVFRFN